MKKQPHPNRNYLGYKGYNRDKKGLGFPKSRGPFFGGLHCRNDGTLGTKLVPITCGKYHVYGVKVKLLLGSGT